MTKFFGGWAIPLLLSFSSLISALPTSEADAYPNMVVLIRNGTADTFAHSPTMAEQVKSEFRAATRTWEHGPEVVTKRDIDSPLTAREIALKDKRSYISLSYCQTTTCTECTAISSTFSTNSCVNVPGTQCILISDLSDAKIRYWNHSGCNGNESTFEGCGETGDVNAPGTGSIGLQIGCS